MADIIEKIIMHSIGLISGIVAELVDMVAGLLLFCCGLFLFCAFVAPFVTFGFWWGVLFYIVTTSFIVNFRNAIFE